MLVTIVAVGRPDGLGLDLDRLEKVEDLPAEIAQKMLDGGTGRKPSDAELAAYRKTIDAKPQSPYDSGGHLPSGVTTVSLDTFESSATSE